MKLIPLFALSATLAAAQPLTLRDAVRLALRENPSIAAAAASAGAVSARVREARAGMLPKLTYSESLTRGNNPVYVFGSLLTQRQLLPGNFYAPVNNFQSQLTLDQPIYDGGLTRIGVKTANLGVRMTEI